MASNLRDVRQIANYQFGEGVGKVLFPDGVEFTYTKSDRVRQIYLDGSHVATLKTSGRFSLGRRGASLLHENVDPPSLRVRFGEESEPFLRDGRNGFAKFVQEVDPEVRCRDEVVITGPGDELLGAGRAELSAREMKEFGRGVAVKQR